MGAVLTQGGNVALDAAVVDVTVRAAAPVDVAAVLLTPEGRVRSDADLVFYNQPEGPGVEHRSAGIRCDLAAVPPTIDRITVVASLDGTGPTTFAALGTCTADVLDATGASSATFELGPMGTETAVILVEVYRRGQAWKVRAVGQGWASGLAGIATSFGVDVGTKTPSPPAAVGPKVPLGKVTLEKRGASRKVSLAKTEAQRALHFNLNWSQRAAGRGLLGRASADADLDVGCMVEMLNGFKAVVQPLGERFGHRDAPPFIYLDKDDRSGASEGENLYVLRPDLVRRVLVFGMIYEGAPDFTSVGATLTIDDQENNQTVIPLNSPDPGLTWCAICLVTNEGNTVDISKQERYFKGASAADAAYHFGFTWRPGRK